MACLSSFVLKGCLLATYFSIASMMSTTATQRRQGKYRYDVINT